jgi:hypothetical protein
MPTALLKSAIFWVCLTLLGVAAALPAAAAPSDFDGVWIPDVKDQHGQETQNPPPWKPEIVPQVERLVAEERAGRPFLVLSHCLPHGMPSWMLMTHKRSNG